MSDHRNLEELLEIFLITYNRSLSLDQTLRQLSTSPFKNCQFTVLDNFSSDNTPQVIDSYKSAFPNIKVIRHNKNIGGDYNFLRAIELSTFYYTWILCDDDNYDFSTAGELIEKIETGIFDLIYTTSRSTGHLGWEGFGDTTVQELIRNGARYHRACAFWPSLIFRTEWYVNECFHAAPYMFPSMKFINRSVNFNFRIYVPTDGIVVRSESNPMEVSSLEQFREWVVNTKLLQDKKIKANVIEDYTEKGFLRTLFFWIALEKTKRKDDFLTTLLVIWFRLGPLQKLKFLLLLPVMIIPLPLSWLVRAREIAYRFMGQKDASKLPPVTTISREGFK